MGIDAIAILPRVAVLGSGAPGEWQVGDGPTGVKAAFCRLPDSTLVNLGISFQSPDADLYERAKEWLGRAPGAKVWVFPDTDDPPLGNAKAVREATAASGRWIKAGPRAAGKPQWFEKIGLTPEEIAVYRREMNSGDPGRVDKAYQAIMKQLEGQDPNEMQAALQGFLRGE